MSETVTETDLQLLARYTRVRAEDAFTRLVHRHLGLVHSAALRQVRSPQLAEEVAQSVFTDLARNAQGLAPDTILTAWLYQVTRRTAIDVVRRETRRQLREQIATEMNTMNAHAADWTHIEPLLDDAMAALDETDRAAVLLRYFENKSLREVGATLGTSDDAAQKRVSRAVERLREFFTKQGVTVGSSGLAVVISSNAVQAAPVGLALAISTATTLTGTALATTATLTATKAIAMTALQKTIVTATIAVLAGAGIYEARQASQLHYQVQTLEQRQAPLAAQVTQLSQALIEATNQVAGLQVENERLNRNTAELLKLRGQVGMLRKESGELKRLLKTNIQIPHTAEAAETDSQNAATLQTVAKIFVTRIKQPQTISEEEIRTQISAKLGDNLDLLTVDRDVRNLYGTSLFKDVRVDKTNSAAGIILNYLLQEKPRLAGINFTGNSKFRETELANIMVSKVGESLDERTLFSDAQMIQERYVKSGFGDTKVKYSTRVNEDIGEGEVTFEITE